MNTREHAIATLSRLGYSEHAIAQIVRQLPAIQRAHEAACNWPEPVAQPFVDAGNRAFARLAIALDNPPVSQVGQRGWSSIGVRPRVVATRQTDPRGCCIELWTMPRKPSEQEPLARLCAHGFTVAQIERIDAVERRRQAIKVAS